MRRSGVAYTGISAEIYSEFNALLDYIWKTPQFIIEQIALERRKLDAYFPAQGGPNADPHITYLRRLRSANEGAKLFNDFPRYLAASNLFLAASTFEKYLYQICKSIERVDARLRDQRGNGVGRYLGFLTKVGLSPHEIGLYSQIDAAIAFRNALLHADGRMDICRDRSKIEQIVNGLTYVEQERRKQGEPLDEFGNPEVGLSGNPTQLKIDNYYAYRAAAYFRDFALSLAETAKDL